MEIKRVRSYKIFQDNYREISNNLPALNAVVSLVNMDCLDFRPFPWEPIGLILHAVIDNAL